MAKTSKTFRNMTLGALVALMAGTLVCSQILPVAGGIFGAHSSASAESAITKLDGELVTDHLSKADTALSKRLPEGYTEDDEISVIVTSTSETVLDAFEKTSVSRYATFAEFEASAEAKATGRRIADKNADALRYAENSGVKFRYAAEYSALLGGFELEIRAGDYEKLAAALEKGGYSASVSEVYEVAEAKVVKNTVNVYKTGIFKNDSKYDGSGTVIAVLDTGLDYTHTAFDVNRFTSKNLAMTPEDIAVVFDSLEAKRLSPEISVANVYYNEKIPFMYDYADGDPDVSPLLEAHGTHVSGIIVGKDTEITGVAPNAQLVSMKVFSDKQSGARWSWVLSALEDCVRLDVDVINMSLGRAVGFSHEEEDVREAAIYDRLTERGISLVAAASNDYNSFHGSEKNGNLGLTSNPDSATVGSPSTDMAALSVASVSGVMTPYLTYQGQIIYFTEASDAASEPKHFVEEIMASSAYKEKYGDATSAEIEYVCIPGVGRSQDYNGFDVEGKLVLVARGDTSFEEKARTANNKHALGIIIYNNVSGDIAMTVGNVTLPACSISLDNGSLLTGNGQLTGGKVRIDKEQVAGPFMSDFSSWGPTPDLRIKPEITAHGGDIYSAIPGGGYDRLSGTSMASPNQAGVTALVRQYVNEKWPTLSHAEAAARVNQIMMSTADIAHNKIDLPYSVRKQGAGLANLTKATASLAYITTFARNDAALANSDDTTASTRFTDEVMNKAKIEFGDDKKKSGDYELKFNIVNTSSETLTYNVDAIVMTEGVSETKTHKSQTTVTEEGYILEGAKVSVESVSTGGSKSDNGNTVQIAANKTVTVVVRIVLTPENKQYLDQSFENGMYVEGYVCLTPEKEDAAKGIVSLNVPYLAFYGDWTEAPVFDLDYFETDRDDRDTSFDSHPLDRTLPDVFATMPIGGLEGDYITALGSYYFIQDPSLPQLSADRKYISLTNQTDGVNSIYALYAGLLRGSKKMIMTITDSTTGEVIWQKTEVNQRKSSSGTSPSFVDVDFSAIEADLRNNTKYLFRAEAVLDYPGEQSNKKSTFEFPFTTDFLSPVLTDVQFTVEYDRTEKKNRLYAHAFIYDNHYAMAADFGSVYRASDGKYTLDSYSGYLTPIRGNENSVSEVVFELTDYVGKFRNSANKNSFVIYIYDYAMNRAYYEVNIPDSVRYINFTEEGDKVTLSTNQTYPLEPEVFPNGEWRETLEYTSSNESVARVAGGTLYAVGKGEAVITARSAEDPSVSATLTVEVLGQGDPGYVPYTKSEIETFRLTGYRTDYAFYYVVSSDRDISVTGAVTYIPATATTWSLEMFPSEKVTIQYELVSYFPESTRVRFSSGNSNVVRVDENGQITAVAEGVASVSVRVVSVDETGKETVNPFYNRSFVITVKNPYERLGPYLVRYTGGGDSAGTVSIPASLGFTEIQQYAFTGYEYIPKFASEGDVINEEDPATRKSWYHGDNPDVKKIILPEGIETIGAYAFAGLKSLEEVVLPKSLTKIGLGAFMGCTNLKTINLDNVQFINQNAFAPGPIRDPDTYAITSYEYVPLSNVTKSNFASVVGIGDSAFRNTGLMEIELPVSAQSVGANAFAGCTDLAEVTIRASKIKLGAQAFASCTKLDEIRINASVIPDFTFAGCTKLSTVVLGQDVEQIGHNAFEGTAITQFRVNSDNSRFSAEGDYLVNAAGDTLVYALPNVQRFALAKDSKVTKVGAGAFSGNNRLVSANLPGVTEIGDYAFYGCTRLNSFSSAALKSVGQYAFAGTAITTMPEIAAAEEGSYIAIGASAFAATRLTSVTLGDRVEIGDSAFYNIPTLTSVTLGDDVKIGSAAFQCIVRSSRQSIAIGEGTGYVLYYSFSSGLKSVTIGDRPEIGSYSFAGSSVLTKLEIGSDAVIGEGAFYLAIGLEEVDLSEAVEIGDGAFSGFLNRIYTSGGSFTGYIAGIQAPRLKTVDLSSATKIGMQAFAYNTLLTDVTFSDDLETIGDAAFMDTSLGSVDLKNIVSVGSYAFYGNCLAEVDLGNVNTIGAYAFASNGVSDDDGNDTATLKRAELREGAEIGDGAFASNGALTQVVNLDKATVIGANAFRATGLAGKLVLTAAQSIGSYAFAETAVTDVDFGAERNLVSLGENPFYGCELNAFAQVTDIEFDGEVVGQQAETTFEVSDSVQVIGGALYKTLPNGTLELVSYPLAMGGTKYVIADGTARISALAFAGSKLVSVELPATLGAIGHKAFFECADLRIVTFKSLNAPILEEEYDENYQIIGNLPGPAVGYAFLFPGMSGTPSNYLHITEYIMWNITTSQFFYGANFVDYIGGKNNHRDLTMIRPINGVGYDSFLYGCYFGETIDGSVAADSRTVSVIATIAALPDRITLDHEELVAEARRQYDLITDPAQQALVSNYSKLQSAENTIEYYKRQQQPAPTPGEDDDKDKGCGGVIAGSCAAGAVAVIGIAAILIARKKKHDGE